MGSGHHAGGQYTRRGMLTALLAFPTAVRVARAVTGQARRPQPRVRPHDPEWPDATAWAALHAATDGNLIVPVALLQPCADDPSSQTCLERRKNLRNPYFLGDDPAGTQVSGWFNAWEPHVSAHAVAARTSAHVAAAVNFARAHRLRLVVKGGGHSYQGTSSAPDSLLIWTRHMRRVTLHDRFVPLDCERLLRPVPAVSAEAGCLWIDLYREVTTKAKRYVQGGGCTTVGVAGLVQSGGFGSFSRGFGTAAAHLLEAEVVTADGRVRIVNPRRDPDLFWALKGGGGGTFGVVTRVTLRTHDLPASFGSVTASITATSPAAFADLVTRLMDVCATSLVNPHWGETVSLQPAYRLKIGMVSQGLTREQMREVWQPFWDWIAAHPGTYTVEQPPAIATRPAATWWDMEERRSHDPADVIFDDRPAADPTHAWWSGDAEQVSAFLHGYDSVWLPRALLAPRRRATLVAALCDASRETAVTLHFNKALAGAPEAAVAATRQTAMHPDVLGAFALAIVANGGPPPLAPLGLRLDVAAAQRNAASVDRAMQPLRRIAPGAGSYVSESNYFNRSWQSAFWGRNYSRLHAIKSKYDSAGLFYVHHGVGSERWREGGFEPT
jgi:FAD/FMN-containing dehydrogenase